MIDRLLARYLKRRGWIVFWLEPEARFCSKCNTPNGVCWLQEYTQHEWRRKKSKGREKLRNEKR